MQKVTFYTLPIKLFRNLDAETIRDFKELAKRIDQLGDTVMIPDSFFDCDPDGTCLYNAPVNSDIKLLIQFVNRSVKAPISIDAIDTADYHNRFIRIDAPASEDGAEVIHNKNELTRYYQASASLLPGFPDLFEWRERCYPSLAFTADSFGNNHHAFRGAPQKDISLLMFQTAQCLSELNERTAELHSVSITDGLAILQAALPQISCSGKGNAETQSYSKRVTDTRDDTQTSYPVSCSPHFKLIRGDSDYRIYFSWGHKKIRKHAFIIAKIGSHWDEAVDTAAAEIV